MEKENGGNKREIRTEFIVDSGASDNMVKDISLISNVVEIPQKYIVLGDGKTVIALKMGDLDLKPIIEVGEDW